MAAPQSLRKKRSPLLGLAIAALLLAAFALPADEAQPSDRKGPLMETKLYILKNTSAAELAPFVDATLRKAAQQGTAESVSSNGRSLLLVNAPQDRIASVDEMVAKLDAPPSSSAKGAQTTMQGYSSYKARFVPVKSLAAMIATISLEAGGDGRVIQDQEDGRVYWKANPKIDAAAGKLMAKADVPQTQMRMIFKAYALDAGTVGVMGEILLSRRPEDVKAPDAAIISTITGCGGVRLVATAECAVAQGTSTSKAIFESGLPERLAITVSSPVICESAGKAESIYSDFVFDNGSDIRNARWTLKSGVEKPLAAFSIHSGGKGREMAHYVDISSLPSIFRGADKATATNEMLIITGLATQAPE